MGKFSKELKFLTKKARLEKKLKKFSTTKPIIANFIFFSFIEKNGVVICIYIFFVFLFSSLFFDIKSPI